MRRGGRSAGEKRHGEIPGVMISSGCPVFPKINPQYSTGRRPYGISALMDPGTESCWRTRPSALVTKQAQPIGKPDATLDLLGIMLKWVTIFR